MTDAATQDRQERILSVIRKGNEFAAQKFKAVAGAVPVAKIPFGEDALAYARRLPAPADVVESAFGLADRLTAERRKLAGEVKKAAETLLKAGEKAVGAAGTAEVTEVAETPESAETAEVVEITEAAKSTKAANGTKAAKGARAGKAAEKDGNE